MIDEFVVKIGFDSGGAVDEVRYWDQGGCGHEHVMSLGDDLDDLVQHHLKHMAQSHGLRPPRRCTYVLATVDKGQLFCTLDPHPEHVKHRFEVAM